ARLTEQLVDHTLPLHDALPIYPATLQLRELHDLHERGRLPAARLADKREALALMDVEGDAVYRALLPDLPAQHHALGDREDPLELLDLEDLRRLGGVRDVARDRIGPDASDGASFLRLHLAALDRETFGGGGLAVHARHS